LIERFKNYWDWNVLSENDSLPWSAELIDRFIDRWKWGYFKSFKHDPNLNAGEMGLIGNWGIPWNIDLIIRYEEFIDIEELKRDWKIWDKVFKPSMDEKMVDLLFRLI